MFGGSAGSGVHAADEREAGRGANGPGKATFEEHAFAGEFIKGGRVCRLIAVAAEEDVVIFADDPEDVGTIGGSGTEGGAGTQDQPAE